MDPRFCSHNFVQYEGLYDMFTYCEECGLKEKDKSKLWDILFLKEEFPKLFKKEETKPEAKPEAKPEDINTKESADIPSPKFKVKPGQSYQIVDGDDWDEYFNPESWTGSID